MASRQSTISKLLLFLEKHCEADDGTVDQKAPDDGHDHGRHLDQAAMSKERR